MLKIAIPTDFSQNAWNATMYALNLFKEEYCKFYLLNTYTPLQNSIEYNLPSSMQLELDKHLKKNSTEGLNKVLKKIKKLFKNSKHTFVTISSFNALTPKLEQMVVQEQIHYIVMGTKGASGIKEILFGSNTVHVLKKVRCPVLAIPSEFFYEKPLEILFPSDYELRFKSSHIQPIINIAKIHRSNVNILNAAFGYDLSSKQEANKQRLEIYLNKTTHLFHRVHNQSVSESIEIFRQKNRINLLVMINNKHSFFENLFFKSLINQIGFHLTIPFLVIPTLEIKSKKVLIANP